VHVAGGVNTSSRMGLYEHPKGRTNINNLNIRYNLKHTSLESLCCCNEVSYNTVHFRIGKSLGYPCGD
jgi:hypothetical protein